MKPLKNLSPVFQNKTDTLRLSLLRAKKIYISNYLSVFSLYDLSLSNQQNESCRSFCRFLTGETNQTLMLKLMLHSRDKTDGDKTDRSRL